MTDPDIIFHYGLVVVTTTRVPHSHSNDINPVVITTDEGDVPSDEYLISERYIALDCATGPELNVVTENDPAMR